MSCDDISDSPGRWAISVRPRAARFGAPDDIQQPDITAIGTVAAKLLRNFAEQALEPRANDVDNQHDQRDEHEPRGDYEKGVEPVHAAIFCGKSLVDSGMSRSSASRSSAGCRHSGIAFLAFQE